MITILPSYVLYIWESESDLKILAERERKYRKASEEIEGFCFIIVIIGLNRHVQKKGGGSGSGLFCADTSVVNLMRRCFIYHEISVKICFI
jgi:hypothetical protein